MYVRDAMATLSSCVLFLNPPPPTIKSTPGLQSCVGVRLGERGDTQRTAVREKCCRLMGNLDCPAMSLFLVKDLV